MNKQTLTELLWVLVKTETPREGDKMAEGQVANPECLSLPRLRLSLLREDWSEKETEHIRECPACQRAKEQMRQAVWHPTVPQLFRHLRGSLTGVDAVDVTYHLTQDQCRHCRALLDRLADAGRMAAEDAPKLRSTFAAVQRDDAEAVADWQAWARQELTRPTLNGEIRQVLQEIAPAAEKGQGITAAVLMTLIVNAHRCLSVGFRTMDLATAQPSGPDVWTLTTAEGSADIPLPADVAERCYGNAVQTVTVRLHRVPVAEAAEMFEPQLEVTPAPTREALTLVFAFANGEQRTLTVAVPPGKRSSAWSKKCEPLPAAAFGTDGWELSVELRQRLFQPEYTAGWRQFFEPTSFGGGYA